MRALLLGVHVKAADFWKLSDDKASLHTLALQVYKHTLNRKFTTGIYFGIIWSPRDRGPKSAGHVELLVCTTPCLSCACAAMQFQLPWLPLVIEPRGPHQHKDPRKQGLRTRIQDPCVYVVFWAPRSVLHSSRNPEGPHTLPLWKQGSETMYGLVLGDLIPQWHSDCTLCEREPRGCKILQVVIPGVSKGPSRYTSSYWTP